MKNITLDRFFMKRDSQYKSELTPEITANATALLEKVNALLAELEDIGELKKDQDYMVSSGWRPPSFNKTVGNAAKKSLHMTGNAIDIMDNKLQTLAYTIKKNASLLKKYGLWMEDPDSTMGKFTNWCHLDNSTTRTDRNIRIFKP